MEIIEFVNESGRQRMIERRGHSMGLFEGQSGPYKAYTVQRLPRRLWLRRGHQRADFRLFNGPGSIRRLLGHIAAAFMLFFGLGCWALLFIGIVP